MRTEADHLIEELRRRHWIQYRWGPLDDPALLAWVYDFGNCADVIMLREWGEDATQSVNGASGYRRPMLTGWDFFDPEVVTYQYHAVVTHTLRRMLTLPRPGTPGAPTLMERPRHRVPTPAQPAGSRGNPSARPVRSVTGKENMKSTLFTLANIADPHEVVALGMEITFEQPRSGEQRRVATTYVPDLSGSGKDTQTRHASAEAARDFFSRLLPVNVDLLRPDPTDMQ